MPGQVYAVNTLGGYWSVPYLSQNIRSLSQPEYRLRQMCDAKEAIGKGRGDTFLFNKTGNVLTQGGKLQETATIPETEFVTGQGTATIDEYGNSIPFTAKLDALGQFEISPTVEQKLRDDQVKVLESAAAAQFMLTDFVAVQTATNGVVITTNGTATATATSNLTAHNVRKIVQFMKKRLIPRMGGTYACVGSVEALAGFYDDVATGGFTDISKYTESGRQALLNGEVGTYYMTRFVEETGFLSNTIGSGSTYGQAVFMGADTVYEAVAIPEEIRVKPPVNDYGRDLGMAWYALLGWKLVWNFAADQEQHIVVVTSA